MSRMKRFILLFLFAYASTTIIFLSLVEENRNYIGKIGWGDVSPSIPSGVRRLRDSAASQILSHPPRTTQITRRNKRVRNKSRPGNDSGQSKYKYGSPRNKFGISSPVMYSCKDDAKYRARLDVVYVKLTKNIALYSAYYDAREDIPYIRIIASVARHAKNSTLLWCHFDPEGVDTNISLVTQVTYYQMCENHNRDIGGWIISCQVPRWYVDKGRSPCAVSVSLSPTESITNSAQMSILTTEKSAQEAQVDFAVCVPPLFGKIRKDEIVQFVELTRLLGANHFVFYVYDVKPDVKEVLKYYESMGIATILKWAIPSRNVRSIWYYGQSLAINDCLYRHMATVQYLIFNDVDEFLIPHAPDTRTWRDIVAAHHMFTNTCAMTFKSTFFDLAFRYNLDFAVRNVSVLDITTRAVFYSDFRNKVLVEPSKVFEMGIHHVSRPWPDAANYSVVNVSPEKAYIHHYRPCKTFSMNCFQGTIDTTLVDKYGEEFFIKYNRTMNTTPH
ncbi:beta-1,4-galactosyltransferase galt-1-like [Haliotis rubra]|uniref:beta-1,4-galactosyltransferase galt-1-like n=1 Tax=Haliotis rubra TaxID=36100 RepID=UPI001EE60FEF|nr:beta-1,4-galactosyltransferase galt-1-like [Haliotis rubra]